MIKIGRLWLPKVKVAQLCPTLCGSHGLFSPWNSPGQNTGVDSSSFLQGSSQPRDQTQVSCIAGRFFTSGATREALSQHLNPKGLKNLNSLKASRNHFSKRAKSFSLNLKEFKRFFCFLCLRPFWFSSTCLLPHLSLPFWIDSTLVMTDTYSENVGNSSSVFKSASSEF